ncbi:hypothetical protein CWB89_17495 [Pseudoalteromonas piscicida]|uniref:Integrase catalytic domain-containing protein n=1 Tax=Pseudoalteromonas piscicida TaxID=43662 RepID=A0AAQ2EST8_PSEO7|nr:hypothetical protein CWB95_19320 [Pseudoalteromonas piscicida]TMN83154.1 hypothetical protein CWB87_09025 [Pseudoalteromonas flavipulchra]TMN43296.1 hypothetical protein CWB94_03285 [Pseudoalteromonas piscicida]TMN51871.1 hypothetical protein CWB93_18425 [Pseudoalteromonas piscicida]TMN52608.1 hypothetical protein CWB92_09555 [Pseudoalteromonas piscicida]
MRKSKFTETQIVSMIKEAEPGSPYQNGFVERFNRSYREEVLDLYLFESLQEVRETTDEWLDIYNYERPHDSLGDMTPIGYLEAA